MFLLRQRFEATNCWLYDYDGIYPPPNSTASANSLRASGDDVIDNDSTKNVKIHHEVKDKKSRVYESKGSLVGEEKKSEFSSTFGLTAEETRDFWDMLLPTETGSGERTYHMKETLMYSRKTLINTHISSNSIHFMLF